MRWRRIMLRKMRWRIMKLRMMMWRGRKMMMLRRRTDPKTEDHTLWELAQSKCTSTFQKSHCIRKFTGKMPRPRWSPERGHTHTHFVRACAVEMHVNISQEPLGNLQEKCRGPKAGPALCASQLNRNACQHVTRATLYRNLQEKCRGHPRPRLSPERRHTHTLTLCEPAQSKCMSTFHKSHFIRKIKGKMLWPSWSTLIKHQLLHLP